MGLSSKRAQQLGLFLSTVKIGVATASQKEAVATSTRSATRTHDGLSGSTEALQPRGDLLGRRGLRNFGVVLSDANAVHENSSGLGPLTVVTLAVLK